MSRGRSRQRVAARRLAILLSAVLCSAALTVGRPAAADEPFLRDGDRVAFLGNAFFEHARAHGYLETLLTQLAPDRDVRFRNLGWSGDDVLGRARSGFDPQTKGFDRLREHVAAVDPTVIILSYGMESTYEGQAGIDRFAAELRRLLDAVAGAEVRVAFVGPLRHEKLPAPLPDPASHNEWVAKCGELLRAVAAERGAPYVDLYGALGAVLDREGIPLTDNGIHPTAWGYWRSAPALASALGLEQPSWRVDVDIAGASVTAVGTRCEDERIGPEGFELRLLDARLPACPPPQISVPPGSPLRDAPHEPDRVLRVRGLGEGNWRLEVDGQSVASGTAAEWAEGVRLGRGPEYEQVEKLRDEVVLKNYLHFHSWRPQNNTYLFLFRKHEQGHLAGEVKDFQPLIEKGEARIAELRRPVPRLYQLSREARD